MKNKLILESGIAGVGYHIHEDDKELLEELKKNKVVILKREPNNRFDKWAIAIYTKKSDNLVGYVPRYKNEVLARMMDQGIKLIAFMDSPEEVQDREGASPTQDLRYPFSVYMETSDENMDIPDTTSINVNKTLLMNMETYFHRLNRIKTQPHWKILTTIEQQMKEDLTAFAVYLAGADGKIVWQEAEFIDIYMKIPQSTRSMKETFLKKKMNEKEFYKTAPLSLICLVDYLGGNEKKDGTELISGYYKLFESFSDELISCDQEVTEDEKTFQRKYLRMIKRYINTNVSGYRTEEIIDLPEKPKRKIIKKSGEDARKIFKK